MDILNLTFAVVLEKVLQEGDNMKALPQLRRLLSDIPGNSSINMEAYI